MLLYTWAKWRYHNKTAAEPLTCVNLKHQSKGFQQAHNFVGLDVQPSNGENKGSHAQDELDGPWRGLLAGHQEKQHHREYQTCTSEEDIITGQNTQTFPFAGRSKPSTFTLNYVALNNRARHNSKAILTQQMHMSKVYGFV